MSEAKHNARNEVSRYFALWATAISKLKRTFYWSLSPQGLKVCTHSWIHRVLLTSYQRAEAEEWNELQVEPEYVNPTAHLASAARVVLEFHAISCILIEVPHPSRLLTTLPKTVDSASNSPEIRRQLATFCASQSSCWCHWALPAPRFPLDVIFSGGWLQLARANSLISTFAKIEHIPELCRRLTMCSFHKVLFPKTQII